MFYKRDKINLCYGSGSVLEKPVFGHGEKSNDFGLGFYTVFEDDRELAKEWACSRYNNTNEGYINDYEFDMSGIEILDLSKMPIIYWVALTAYSRDFIFNYKDKLLREYLLDVSMFDCIYGWRCDDNYSNILSLFFDDIITDIAILKMIELGYLQSQFVLKSEKAFSNIKFIKSTRIKDFVEYRKYFDNKRFLVDQKMKELGRLHRNEGRYYFQYIEELHND